VRTDAVRLRGGAIGLATVIVEPAPGTPDDRSCISTPDRRLRVFVSSTLQELAAERRGPGHDHQAPPRPVMVKLGARPHPARELDRAYLAQTEVFAGIYRGLHACMREASTGPVELGHDHVAGTLSPACRLGGHADTATAELEDAQIASTPLGW
jgi:hypothetical protein